VISKAAASMGFIMKNWWEDCFIKGFGTSKFENLLLNRLICVAIEHS